MACAQRSPEHPYLRSFIPFGQLRLTRLPAPVPSPSPWLGFQARRLLRRTRTLLSIVSLCPDRSSWSSSATGKDAAAGSPTLLLPSEEEAKKKIYNVSCERYFGFGCEIDEETSNKLEGIPGVLFVLPDSCVDPAHKDYRGFFTRFTLPKLDICYSTQIHMIGAEDSAPASRTRPQGG